LGWHCAVIVIACGLLTVRALRLQTSILAVESEQDAHAELCPADPTHMQPGEVRTPVGIARHHLPVEHGRLSGQLVQQL